MRNLQVLFLRNIPAGGSLRTTPAPRGEAARGRWLTRAEGMALCPHPSPFLRIFIGASEGAVARAGGWGKQSQRLTRFC